MTDGPPAGGAFTAAGGEARAGGDFSKKHPRELT